MSEAFDQRPSLCCCLQGVQGHSGVCPYLPSDGLSGSVTTPARFLSPSCPLALTQLSVCPCRGTPSNHTLHMQAVSLRHLTPVACYTFQTGAASEISNHCLEPFIALNLPQCTHMHSKLKCRTHEHNWTRVQLVMNIMIMAYVKPPLVGTLEVAQLSQEHTRLSNPLSLSLNDSIVSLAVPLRLTKKSSNKGLSDAFITDGQYH